MENKLTKEKFDKLKECKTVGEVIALAKENSIELTEAEATNIFAQINSKNEELSDNELKNISGGACGEDENVVYACEFCHDGKLTNPTGGTYEGMEYDKRVMIYRSPSTVDVKVRYCSHCNTPVAMQIFDGWDWTPYPKK